jgi:hypothetical protein
MNVFRVSDGDVTGMLFEPNIVMMRPSSVLLLSRKEPRAMKKQAGIAARPLSLILYFVFIIGSSSSAVHAQNIRSWVAAAGSDSANCSFATPCASFGGAFAKTLAGGEITCIDSANFGGANITKSITINCDGARANAAVSTNNLGSFYINTAVSDHVFLRGLDVDCSDVGCVPVTFTGAGTLILDRMKLNNGTAPGGGVQFVPNGSSKLIITDSIIARNGSPTQGAGVFVRPQAGGTAQVTLDHVNVLANTFGIAADGTDSTGGINMTVKDSVLASNINDGIIAVTPAGGAPIGIMVSNSASTNNGFGIRSIGPNVTVRVENTKVIGNSTGLSFSSGGALLTFGNNAVRANGIDGAFSGPVALQ